MSKIKGKGKILFFTLISIVLIFIGSNIKPVRAATYGFEIDYMQANVYIEIDGSVTIEYTINFTCDLGARAIDVVDIGFPNQHYNLTSVQAKINGKNIASSRIQVSEVIPIGVEIWLDSNRIDPDESGQLYVIGNNPQMVFQDYENQSLASVEFSPTWFDDDYASRYEYLEVNIYFPPGYTEGNLVKYHYTPYTDFREEIVDGLKTLVYRWTKSNAPMQQYMYGVSFPADAIDYQLPWTANPQVVSNIIVILSIISLIGLLGGISYAVGRYIWRSKKIYYPPRKRTYPGSICGAIWIGIIFGFIFFMMFWGIFGDIVWIILFFIFLIAGFGMIGFLIYKALSRIRLPYSKPDMKIECVGVNKDLSVVEAAIIKNTDLNKVIFLIMFGLIRSGHLQVLDIEPLKLQVVSTKGISKMKTYLKKFLKAVPESGAEEGKVNDIKLKKLLVDLIKATHGKMKGYNLEATIHYYDYMINEAWETIKNMPTEIKWEDIEKEFDWIVIDDMFEKRSERYLTHRYYYYRPYWYDHYFYYRYYWGRGYYRHYYPTASLKTVPMQHINMHTMCDSIARSMENIGNTIVKNFTSFAESIVNTVAPAPKPTGGRGGGRSYSGGGCACACACAGCACACAGGGR